MNQHPAALPVDQLLKNCDEIRTRRSGPGGQHRNKVETAVVLTHRPSGISAEAGERRSQADNRRVAVFRLRINLALQIRSAPDEASATESADKGANPLWRSRVHGGRIGINPAHDDFPALLATALDVLASSAWDAAAAAEWLGTTSSQLVRFLKLEPRAFQLLNSFRIERGLRPLR